MGLVFGPNLGPFLVHFGVLWGSHSGPPFEQKHKETNGFGPFGVLVSVPFGAHFGPILGPILVPFLDPRNGKILEQNFNFLEIQKMGHFAQESGRP